MIIDFKDYMRIKNKYEFFLRAEKAYEKQNGPGKTDVILRDSIQIDYISKEIERLERVLQLCNGKGVNESDVAKSIEELLSVKDYLNYEIKNQNHYDE